MNHLEPQPQSAQGTQAHENVAALRGDGGYTLIELIILVVIIGVFCLTAILAVPAITTQAAGTGCRSDARLLEAAALAHLAHTGTSTIAPTGTDHDRFEITLVDAGLLRTTSPIHDLDATGVLSPEENSSC